MKKIYCIFIWCYNETHTRKAYTFIICVYINYIFVCNGKWTYWLCFCHYNCKGRIRILQYFQIWINSKIESEIYFLMALYNKYIYLGSTSGYRPVMALPQVRDLTWHSIFILGLLRVNSSCKTLWNRLAKSCCWIWERANRNQCIHRIQWLRPWCGYSINIIWILYCEVSE